MFELFEIDCIFYQSDNWLGWPRNIVKQIDVINDADMKFCLWKVHTLKKKFGYRTLPNLTFDLSGQMATDFLNFC